MKLDLPGLTAVSVFLACAATAQPFHLPTANRLLLEPGGEPKYFVGTVGKPWISGTFGCVRSDGHQIHEGIDIRCLRHDQRGEPIDPVLATAAGAVAYLNPKAGLSNYGQYVVLRHQVEGLEIYSLYAHLREIRSDLKIGATVKAGETIATMGRTTNTRSPISKDRAHLHFELNFLVNDRFATWYQSTFPGQRNDHGAWNGQNLVGIDPRALLLAEVRPGAKFSLRQFLRQETELCRVLVRKTSFPWVRRYAPLIQRNPAAEKEGVAGYEMSLDFNGVPFAIIPRAASEIKNGPTYQLLSVNDQEQQKNPGRHWVVQRAGHWALGAKGLQWLDLLTY